MLHLVTGPSGSGKTETVRNKLKTLAETGKEKLLLLVPEQYSFLSERGILETLGEKLGQKVEVLSFKRLSDYVFRELGGMAGQEADDATRIILMMRALSAVQDKLTVYGKQAENISLARELLLFVKELHRAGVTATQLKEVAVDLQK
ncbi:MAG TPA: helicase, partial [Clostridiales bacterium]|nr:helicase [Clostridiales bacterium]